MVKSSKVSEVQHNRSSLRIYQKCIQKYKNNAIQRVKTFKQTHALVKSCKKESSFICETTHHNNILYEESVVNDCIQVDCVQHQVLRGYDSIMELVKTKIDMEINNNTTLQVKQHIKMLKCVDFVLNHITFEKPTEDTNTDQVYAIIAGSFPAYLAAYVHEFSDIDVFLVINTLDTTRMKIYHKLIKNLKVINNIINPRGTHHWEYDTNNSDIYTVTTIGDIQFITREYSGCYTYLDNLCFIGFHHVT